MTKYNKYLRTKGIKMECDYPMIPYDTPCLTILEVNTSIDLEEKCIILQTIYTVGTCVTRYYSNGSYTHELI